MRSSETRICTFTWTASWIRPCVLLQDVEPHEAIEMELDKDEDDAVFNDLYDDKPFLHTKMVNGPSYRRWKLSLPVSTHQILDIQLALDLNPQIRLLATL